MSAVDEHQARYLAHQDRKRETLMRIMRERHSDRIFAPEPMAATTLQEIVSLASLCPSSCNRHGVSIAIVTERDKKELLGGILVGGVGWIHRAPAVLMLMADHSAYKAAGETAFMPYLDAGCMVQQVYLHAAATGLKCCFCNPNIRAHNQAHFHAVFGEGIFCGAMAVGNPP